MAEPFDIERARRETRGCEERVHFNNAGASLMPAPVSDALHAYLHEEEQTGGYETEDRNAEALAGFYRAAADLINASPGEIAYVENATRAWDLAFYAFRFAPGDRILTTIAEYGSNVIAYLQQARRYGVEVVFVPNDRHGQIDVEAAARLIDERVKLVSMTHIPTGGGLVNPAARIGALTRAAGIPFILDACQSLGQIPVDVETIGCDVLSATGRKFLRGPRGTGFLYVRDSLLEHLEPPLLDQHAATLTSPRTYRVREDARRFENWEQYCAGKYALATAIEYARAWGLASIQQRIYALADRLRARLEEVDGVTVTDEGLEKCGIVTFQSRSRPAPAIQSHLATHRINVSVSSGSGSLVSFEQRGITEVVRASVHYFNTEAEIDRFIDVLAQYCRGAD